MLGVGSKMVRGRKAIRLAASISKRSIVRAVKGTLGVVVLLAVSWHVNRTWKDLSGRGGLPTPRFEWVGVAIVLYLAGLGVLGFYFVRVMYASPSPVGVYAGERAYLVSHLGKYVPGKAMVVVLRVAMLASVGARAATAAFATLYETIVMMAAGGVVAFVGLWGRNSAVMPSGRSALSVPVPLGWMGLAVGLGLLVIVHPRVFPILSSLVRLPFPDLGRDALPRVSWRLLGEGLGLAALGWTLLGLSQVAVIRSLTPGGLPVSLWPSAIGAVALATVAGFLVAVAPGGLGVREWVLWTSLGSVIDADLAVVASLGLRLAWVAGEAAIALVLLAIPPSRLRTEATAS